jgi:hypothetical protein
MRTFTIALTLFLLLGATSGTPTPTRAANGDFDRSFGGYGTGGRVLGDLFPGNAIADTVVTPEGALNVVGSNGQDMLIARYNADGTLDARFGTNGVTTLDFNNQTDVASAVALNFDNQQILVACTTFFGPRAARNADFAVARLRLDGTPDTSFSQDGKTTLASMAGPTRQPLCCLLTTIPCW